MNQLVSKFKRYLKIWLLLVKLTMMAEIAYRADIFFYSFASFSWLVFQIILYKLIFSQIKEISGWSFNEMLLLYGVYNLFFGIFVAIFGYLYDMAGEKIKDGKIDLSLVKPISARFLVSFAWLWFDGLIHVVWALFVLVYAIKVLTLNLSFLNLLSFLLLFTNGLIIAYCVCFMLVCSSFWITRASNIYNFFWQFESLAKYPTEIFRKFFGFLLTFFLPVAFIAVVPTKALLGVLAFRYVFYSFLITIIFLILSQWVWNQGLKRYTSASS